MGRYYHGDIEGKFMFAVQESDDASFFGVEGYVPDELHYTFSVIHVPKIKKAIDECYKQLGGNKLSLDKYFDERMGWNDEDLAKYLDTDKDSVKPILKWYARLELGEKILNCVEENGMCRFTAEL